MALDWQVSAACATQGGEFTTLEERPALAALAVCHGCPVKAECLLSGLTDRDAEGVYGEKLVRNGRVKAHGRECRECHATFIVADWRKEQVYCSRLCYKAAA